MQHLTTLCLLATMASAAMADAIMETFTYKTMGDLEIKADVYRADDEAVRPVVVWIHGGALIMGGRQDIDRRIKQMMLEEGYVLVSIDYRLAPETKLPSIISDIDDAFQWIRRQGPRLFHADVGRVAVIGGSAGGYLTLTSGFRVEPRPTVLVSFYGYGDLVGDWYSTPSPHKRHQGTSMSPAEAAEFENGRPIANARDRSQGGGPFYQYCRQHGLWPQKVSTWDPRAQRERFVPYMPVHNVDEHYSPTLLIHGSEDTDVPYDQSNRMKAELERNKVLHQLIRIENAEHGLRDGDAEEVRKAYEAVRQFVNRHMKD